MIVVDSFAGGGGASQGIEQAIRRPVDYAVNHDREAIAMHKANHPLTEHLTEDVWHVDPLRLSQGRRMCGNSVPPPVAEALVAANSQERIIIAV